MILSLAVIFMSTNTFFSVFFSYWSLTPPTSLFKKFMFKDGSIVSVNVSLIRRTFLFPTVDFVIPWYRLSSHQNSTTVLFNIYRTERWKTDRIALKFLNLRVANMIFSVIVIHLKINRIWDFKLFQTLWSYWNIVDSEL